ncbi:MAG: hypothetical protein ACOCWQ_03395 [Nanoarchaeota archaeon]
MKILYVIGLCLFGVFLYGCVRAEGPEIVSFEECVDAGNPVMESYPRQCRADGRLFVEQIDQDMQMCTREYLPVCGEVQVQCVTTPCPPINTTFPNRCEAERAGAREIREGACVESESDPEGACLSFDGRWIEETMECEGMSQQMCEDLGGTFSHCASACRNDPDAQMCTMQCVLVCDFS